MNGHTTLRPRAELDAERWRRLKEIVCDALEEPSGAARTALVESRCGDDAELLADAKSLIEEAGQPNEQLTVSLEECAAQTHAILWQNDDAPGGRRMGAYAVIKELGRGGMGTVYLAARADGQFEREVAIKVMKRGTDTEEVLRRFAAERHILARLDHPNIARLLDAGTTDDGLPYFVMEYVDGAPVTEFVREHKLPLAERLAIFLKICGAVERAHRHHVIHRDLKPSNILVDAEGEPKLLDFGIAKLWQGENEASERTATMQQRFTPLSASPEQVRGGNVTAASDVYALGALLYEMLAEAKPYRFSTARPSLEEVQRAICQAEPPPPSAVSPNETMRKELAGSLDDIVLLAMRKEPACRYASVADFAADIRRYLEGTSVRACPAPFHQRLLRPGSRGRRLAADLVIALICLLSLGIFFQPALRRWFHLTAPAYAAEANSIFDKSLAVLPFQNLSTAPDTTFFADGIHDAILSDLAKVADLKVISQSSVRQFRGESQNLQDIRRQLTVAHVVEGTVQRLGNRVRVSARLIDTRTGAQEWAETYQREVADIFALQSDLAQAIVAQLAAKILPAEKRKIEEPMTRDLAAYDDFLRARKILDSQFDQQDARAALLQAVGLLEEATRRDPAFVLAFCDLARAHDLLYSSGLDPSPARARLAENAIDAALRLQPHSAEAHLAQAEHYFRCFLDSVRAQQELELARAGLPNSPSFFLLSGNVNRRLARWEQGARDFARATELDPKNISAINYLADTQILMRQFSAAIQTYERAAEIGLDSPILRIRIAIIRFAATGNANPLRAALAAAPANLDVGGGETPLRIFTALIAGDTAAASRALAASPLLEFQDVDFSYYYPRSWYEAIIARAAGDRARELTALTAARSVLETRMETNPLNRTRSVLAQVYAGLGLKELAIQEGQAAVDAMPISKDAYEGPLVLQALAQVYLLTGEKERAIEIIEKLLKVPGYLSYGYLAADPAWATLRSEPPFQKLLASLAPDTRN